MCSSEEAEEEGRGCDDLDVLYMISELFVIGAGCIDVVQCR